MTVVQMRRSRFSILGSVIILAACWSFVSQAQQRDKPTSGQPGTELKTISLDSHVTTASSSELSLGLFSAADGSDWLTLEVTDESRSVIKDLGQHEWTDAFKVPAVEPLPELKPGEHREVRIDRADTTIASAGDFPPSRSALDPPARTADSVAPPRPPVEFSAQVTAPRTGKPKLSPPQTFARTLLGHIYVIHVVNPDADFYALARVETVAARHNCTISWKQIPSPPAGTK